MSKVMMEKNVEEDDRDEELNSDDDQHEEQQQQTNLEDAFSSLDKRLINTLKSQYGDEIVGDLEYKLGSKMMIEDDDDEIVEIIDDDDDQMEDEQEVNGDSAIPSRYVFRNYEPTDYKLKRYKKRNYATLNTSEKTSKYFATPIESTEVILRDTLAPLLEIAAKQQSLAGLDKLLVGEDDSAEIALLKPKKLNEDLKRQIKTELEYLEKQTNVALKDMLQERIEEEEEDSEEED
ncbi:predicted protein [Naegleria gruberi]|uniref:Predicted protein n=1 Tax=Naegleria gruberi TaxID=5762 RepID=D2UX34_NAEGR|nr:uncharacterized protein NAEGRDRAFT_61620 [Naegleria gruberi]EFC50554.1 predicted protein [Naegleria gruberi]|eukprot:XP_002683298.1 predicted protein [Naegleria gruberi strain NEG-M]